MIHSVKKTAYVLGILAICATAEITLAQQSVPPSAPPPTFGGSGTTTYLSQFANPALLGSLYLTPQWPMTGYYPLYPGSLSRAIPGDGVLVGPLRLHPHMGVAQMYTDNVFRTNSNKISDFLTTLAERPTMFDTFLGGLFLDSAVISEGFSKWRLSAYGYREKGPPQFVSDDDCPFQDSATARRSCRRGF